MTEQKKDRTSKKDAPEQKPGKKKVYSKPEIVEHGSVTELTKFGGSNRAADFFGRRF